jgi:hypothetical protein
MEKFKDSRESVSETTSEIFKTWLKLRGKELFFLAISLVNLRYEVYDLLAQEKALGEKFDCYLDSLESRVQELWNSVEEKKISSEINLPSLKELPDFDLILKDVTGTLKFTAEEIFSLQREIGLIQSRLLQIVALEELSKSF